MRNVNLLQRKLIVSQIILEHIFAVSLKDVKEFDGCHGGFFFIWLIILDHQRALSNALTQIIFVVLLKT